jgi:diaminopimelate epimerase
MARLDRLVEAVLPMLDAERRFTAVTMPNPHLVHFVDAVDEAELSVWAAFARPHPTGCPTAPMSPRGGARRRAVRPTFERGVA